MPKAKQFDTVVLLESIDGVAAGEKGAVIEAYSTPYEAYDVEIVTDEGKTRALLSAVRPEQIEVVAPAPASVRVDAEELYALTA